MSLESLRTPYGTVRVGFDEVGTFCSATVHAIRIDGKVYSGILWFDSVTIGKPFVLINAPAQFLRLESAARANGGKGERMARTLFSKVARGIARCLNDELRRTQYAVPLKVERVRLRRAIQACDRAMLEHVADTARLHGVADGHRKKLAELDARVKKIRAC